MKLTKIKLAGFKSFVDPTTLPLPGHLVGIVGPNGCGKSNTIDAVRWVMGESSARHLRGESMTDVIFNGSSSRKPVGQASVELIFDNQDGSAGGEYARYSEISIRRTVSRDGQSVYFLNGARCRRRDITDLFLGTGLGPRSYAIIEQGMISRVIEARPEELRSFFEEAAGISKYKERRRETENRIRHTRDNLDRLTDLRDELDKQLQRLQRQAATAERFRELRALEDALKEELLALRWRDLNEDATRQEGEVKGLETRLEAVIAGQRASESELERQRSRQQEAAEGLSQRQAAFYGVGAEISRLEQGIQHQRELRRRHEQELAQAEREWSGLLGLIERDEAQLQQLKEELAADGPELERLREVEIVTGEQREEAERSAQQWQEAWDAFNREVNAPTQSAQIERSQIDHIERQLERQRLRFERLDEEQRKLDDDSLMVETEELAREEEETAEVLAEQQLQLDDRQQQIALLRDQLRDRASRLDQARGQLQQLRGRHASLEALQQGALGGRGGEEGRWLKRQGLSGAPRLAEQLTVDPAWRRAVETVLGDTLEAVVVERLDDHAAALAGLEGGALTLVESLLVETEADDGGQPGQRLADRCRAAGALQQRLAAVWCADDLAQALAWRERLQGDESIITADGIWLGRHTLRVARGGDEHAGVLERAEEIRQIAAQMAGLAEQVDQLGVDLDAARQQLQQQEGERDQLQRELQQGSRRHAELRAQVSARRARLEQHRQRLQRLQEERREVEEQLVRDREELEEARFRLQEALAEMERLEGQRKGLLTQRDQLRQAVEEARAAARQAREASHALALQVEQRRTRQQAIEQGLERTGEQRVRLLERQEELKQGLLEGDEPLLIMQGQLEEQLQRRTEAEGELVAARQLLEEIEQGLRQLEQGRSENERQVQDVRSKLERARLDLQTMTVRRETLREQLTATTATLEEIFARLSAEATIEEWGRRLEENQQRIQRLGAINLAAIDEYREQQERKGYLDAQHNDLVTALETLENAIRKIDRETRSRFRDTFDRVNSGLGELFPRLFGGGQAFLELTGEDLLDSGVAVMARPPGKNVRSIHLLSGGEKALTAVALVFSIFQLNPAPFCMLDEVDAPLDEANVGRFSQLIKAMSDRVQFIFITHNKATMEIAGHLCGVTMHEPGVSRLVAVDVEEASRLAAM